MKKNEAGTEEYAEAMKGMESDTIDADELESLRGSAAPPVVIDLRGSLAKSPFDGAVCIPMENLVENVVSQAVPSKDTTIVLVCHQSFEMTRMVALSSYAYPTLKLLGFANIKILRTWQGLSVPV